MAKKVKTPAPPPPPKYPIPKFHFQVSWGGIHLSFTEVSGLDSESEIIEYRDSNHPGFHKIKMPGMQKHPNITLKRGIIHLPEKEINRWKDLLQASEKKDLTIVLLDEQHQPVLKWKAKRAFPVKLSAPHLKADANEVAIESMELAHEGLTIEK